MKSAIRPGTQTLRFHRHARAVLAALLLGGMAAMIVPRPAEAFVLIRRPWRRIVVVEPRPVYRPGYVVSPAPFFATIVIDGRPCVWHRGHWGYWHRHRFIVVR